MIYDSSSPVVGWLRVGSIHYHVTFVRGGGITVYWGDIIDPHSGVRVTQIGLGSTAHAPDIMEYAETHGSSFNLTDVNILTQGHAYVFFLRVSIMFILLFLTVSI